MRYARRIENRIKFTMDAWKTRRCSQPSRRLTGDRPWSRSRRHFRDPSSGHRTEESDNRGAVLNRGQFGRTSRVTNEIFTLDVGLIDDKRKKKKKKWKYVGTKDKKDRTWCMGTLIEGLIC